MSWLSYYTRKRNGEPLSLLTQRKYLESVKGLFRHLARQRKIAWNPASELEMPRMHRRLPRGILSRDEVETVLAQTHAFGLRGIRDRAILEVLYATGIRRSELANLALYDVDFAQGTLMVRKGKGSKDRLIPIGERALRWTDRYLREVRPQLVVDGGDTTLFLTDHGQPFVNNRLSDLVKSYLERCGIDKPGGCHLFRHTMATLMLENGADLRYIQVMLGHAKLETTAIYTQVAIGKLKEVYERTHPARMQKQSEDGRRKTGEGGDGEA
ncbi:MAG: tyrosine-type recombinase/integrase [Xanthomonadales bacterium]|nr:tyrosine-type recombinase/integrase [Xanthomonadales bacterium]